MEGSASRTLVRDSAGVVIREIAVDARQEVRLTPAPIAQIPSAVAGVYALYRVRDVERLSDGSFVVSNNGTELLRFDRDGEYMATIGRRGEGPGEFRSINAIAVGSDDSLFVFDSNLDRLTVMDREGRGVAMSRLEHSPGGSFYDVVGVVRDGSVLVSDVSMMGGPRVSGTVPLTFDLHVYSRDTEEAPVIGEFRRAPRYRYTEGNGFGTFPVPFQSSVSLATSGDRLIVVDGNRPEVRIQDTHGVLLSIIRLSRDPAPVRSGDIDAYREQRLSRARSERNRHRELAVLDDIDYARYWPFFQDVRIGDDGTIWLRDDGPDLQDDLQRWTGVEPDGSREYALQIAGDFEVMSFRAGTVVGVARDDFDVERVVVYGLESSAGGRGQ